MGNLHQTKAKRKQEHQNETSKKFLSESKKFFAGEYSAFQFIADANNHKGNHIKELSFLNTELQSKQILDYALNIYSEFLPQKTTINTTIYNPFSLLKAQNEVGTTTDFFSNQILFINDFVNENSNRDKQMNNNKNNKPKLASLLNNNSKKQIDDSSIIPTNEPEEKIKYEANNPNDDNEEEGNSKKNSDSNENVDEISDILITDEMKKSNNNLTQLKNGKNGISITTLKPDDQKTVSSLLKQMNIQKGKEFQQKGITNDRNDLVSPIILRQMDTNDNNNNDNNNHNHNIATSQSIKSGRDYNIDIIKTDNSPPVINNQLSKVGKMPLMKSVNKSINLYTIKQITTNDNHNQSKGIMQASSDDYKYKISITEPTKRSQIKKLHNNNNTSRNNGNINQCNQSHLCKRYFKLKKEIEEEEIIQKYCSQRSKNNNNNKKKHNNDSYQITIDLRDLNEEEEEENSNSNTGNDDSNVHKQINPNLNKLITFSPNDDHNNNMMFPNKGNKKSSHKENNIRYSNTGKSSNNNNINKKMTKRGSCPTIPSFNQLRQMNIKKKNNPYYNINKQQHQSSPEDDSSTYLNQNADQSKSNLSVPKVSLIHHNDLSYPGPLISIDKDINKHKKNQIKQVKQKMYNEFISNLKLPQYQIDNKALNDDHTKARTSDLNYALNKFKANNKFLFEYTEEEKKIEEKMKQFDI